MHEEANLIKKRNTTEQFEFSTMDKEMIITNQPLKPKKHSNQFWNNFDSNFDTKTANRDELLV